MKMILTFRQITFQAVHLGPAVIELFTDDGLTTGQGVSARNEQALVNWLTRYEPGRLLLFEQLQRSPAAFYRTEVQEPFYGPQEGDIDLLVCNREAPHQTAVLECKRVKVQVIDEGNDQLNKLDEVGGGVRQAKKLSEKFGFFQTYLAVITAVDAANRKQMNIPCRGVSSESISNWDSSTTTFRRIVEFPRREELPAEVGIIFIEIVQPSGKALEEQGTIRICVHQVAAPRTQRVSDTNKIEALIQETL